MNGTKEKIEALKKKITITEAKGNGSAGVIRKWKREIKKLEAKL